MGSQFVPNTTVSVISDAPDPVPDDWGDERSSSTVVADSVPANLVRRDQRVYQPQEGAWTVVERWRCRLRPGTLITPDNRLQDERSGDVYVVESADNGGAGTVADRDVLLVLRRVPR